MIAQISFDITQTKNSLQVTIAKIEKYAQMNETDRRNILNFAATLKNAEKSLHDFDLASAT